MVEKYTAPTVGKTFRILKSISRSARGLTISELSQQLGISKSTVHGIAAALEELAWNYYDAHEAESRRRERRARLARSALHAPAYAQVRADHHRERRN